MAGTKQGGIKAAQTNRQLYGEGFYKKIGSQGGHNGTTGGWASAVVGVDGLTGKERARVQGAIGGRMSKRGKAKVDKK